MPHKRKAKFHSYKTAPPPRHEMSTDAHNTTTDAHAYEPSCYSSTSAVSHSKHRSTPRPDNKQVDAKQGSVSTTTVEHAVSASTQATACHRRFTPSERAMWHAQIDELVEDTIKEMAKSSSNEELEESNDMAVMERWLDKDYLSALCNYTYFMNKYEDQAVMERWLNEDYVSALCNYTYYLNKYEDQT